MPVVGLPRGVPQIVHVKSPRAPTPPADDLHNVIMAVATTAPSVQAPSHATFSTEGVRAHGDAPLDHGPSPATETRDPNSAVTPCRGSNPAMGARAPTAAPLNHYTGPCTSHAPPRHTSRNKNAAATTRRLLTRAGSSPFLPVRKAAVDLRCGKGNLITAIFFRDATRCLLEKVAGALSFLPSRRSRQA